MVNTNDMTAVHEVFRTFATSMSKRIPTSDPSARRYAPCCYSSTLLCDGLGSYAIVALFHSSTFELCEQVKSLTQAPLPKTLLRLSSIVAWILFAMTIFYLLVCACLDTPLSHSVLTAPSLHHQGRYRDRHLVAVTEVGAFHLQSTDFGAVVALFLSLAYIFGFFGIQYL